MTRQETDSDLLRRLAGGDSAAVRDLVDRKVPRIFRIAMSMLNDRGEAEDVTQDALIRVWRHASRWSPHGTATFDTWLNIVVINLCRDRLRRRREPLYAEPPEQADPHPSVQAVIEDGETADQIRSAVAALPERQREAILLYYFEGLPASEAAVVLDVSVDAFESLLSRGRRKLRVVFKGAGS